MFRSDKQASRSESPTMYSVQNSVHSTEIQEEQQPQQRMKLGDYIPVYIPAIEVGLMNQTEKKPRFLDFLKARPSNDWFLKVLLRNPNPTTPTPTTTGFRVPFVRKISLKRFWKFFKKWIKSPEHFAVFIWLLFVAGGLVLLFLVMIGILNSAIPNSDRRKDWIEIINQILNALFTMMAIYEHPKFFHHLILLLRYKPADQIILRKVYTKNGVPKPNERRHMLFVVALLHITCIAQYVYCGLYWGYTRKTRPEWAENLSIGVGIGAPVVAILYTIYSVLGRVNDEPEEDEELENQHDQQQQQIETIDQKIIITTPEWIGGLFDCGDDTTVSCLSFFCTFCVFGWNMERLGFGNMYVHIITFILFCTAPFWIFAISALNVHDHTIPLILVITGSVLCIFGLLYGGFWRSKMRKKFKLPGTYSCCGSPGIADYLRWLFCWSCALAQEVRTANFYDIEDNGFYRTVTDADGRSVLVPLPREGNMGLLQSYERSRSMPVTPRSVDSDGSRSVGGFGRAMTCPKIPWTKPPSPVLMRVEEERPLRMVQGSD